MIATRQLPVEVLQELANEFAAGLPARAAVMREAIDEIERGDATDAAQRLHLTAHSLAGTASAFGANELVPHAERLESLGKAWLHETNVMKAAITDARRALESLTAAIRTVAGRIRSR
jgi:HPt (histidine-containing phosphotransfer) domain-containing protein